MKRMNKTIMSAVLVSVLALAPAHQAKATFMNAGTEVTQLAHMGTNAMGWANDIANWAQQRIDEINKLTQLITNNVFTEAIRGFNELMTAIQTDISDVLGTLTTLASAPMALFEELKQLPFALWNQLTSPFQDLYADAMGMFSAIGSAQGLGDINDTFKSLFSGGSRFSNAYDFKTKFAGLRTAANAEYLSKPNAEKREALFRKWNEDIKADTFGGDAIQHAATGNQILATVGQEVSRGNELAAMNNLQDTADRISAWEQAKARSAGSYNRSLTFLSTTAW